MRGPQGFAALFIDPRGLGKARESGGAAGARRPGEARVRMLLFHIFLM